MRRLPRKVRFPGGFTLDIKVLPRDGFQCKHCGEYPSGRVAQDELGHYETLAADHGLVVLWKELTPKQRWHKLMHEMLHALADAQLHVEQGF